MLDAGNDAPVRGYSVTSAKDDVVVPGDIVNIIRICRVNANEDIAYPIACRVDAFGSFVYE